MSTQLMGTCQIGGHKNTRTHSAVYTNRMRSNDDDDLKIKQKKDINEMNANTLCHTEHKNSLTSHIRKQTQGNAVQIKIVRLQNDCGCPDFRSYWLQMIDISRFGADKTANRCI